MIWYILSIFSPNINYVKFMAVTVGAVAENYAISNYHILGQKRETLRGRTSTCGETLWCSDDPVHLKQSGYRDIAEAIRGLKDLIDGKDKCADDGTEGSVSSESSTSKRARLDSVVTRPAEPPSRRGNGNNRAYRVASWLQGRNAPATRGSAGRIRYSWRGHGGNHRARAGGQTWRGGWRGPRAYRGRWWIAMSYG